MTDLKNITSSQLVFTCPDCGCKFGKAVQPIFLGIHTVADCVCECCENPYIHTLTTSEQHVFAVSGKTGKTSGTVASLQTEGTEATVKATVYRECREVVFFNCLAATPDEVVQKLLHTHRSRQEHPERGAVVLLPASMVQQAPDFAAEVWTVDLAWPDAEKRIAALDGFVKDKIANYDSVWLADTFLVVEPEPLDVYALLGLSRQEQGSICFVQKADEYWFALPAWLAKRKQHPLVKRILEYRQRIFFRNLLRSVQRRLGTSLVFYTTGMAPSFLENEKSITDLCVPDPTAQQWQEWLEVYAKSRLVVTQQAAEAWMPRLLAGKTLIVAEKAKPTALAQSIAALLVDKH